MVDALASDTARLRVLFFAFNSPQSVVALPLPLKCCDFAHKSFAITPPSVLLFVRAWIIMYRVCLCISTVLILQIFSLIPYLDVGSTFFTSMILAPSMEH